MQHHDTLNAREDDDMIENILSLNVALDSKSIVIHQSWQPHTVRFRIPSVPTFDKVLQPNGCW
jgi:hypothetical protein